MLTKFLNQLINSGSLEEARLNAQQVKNVFKNFTQPISMISFNEELLYATLNQFVNEFEDPKKRKVNAKYVLMLKDLINF